MATYYPDYEEPACPICGSTTLWEDCDNCGGEGTLDVYEEDPLWYDEGDTVICDWCAGRGGHYTCLNLKHHAAQPGGEGM